jgi:hypothetical protein
VEEELCLMIRVLLTIFCLQTTTYGRIPKKRVYVYASKPIEYVCLLSIVHTGLVSRTIALFGLNFISIAFLFLGKAGSFYGSSSSS